MFSKSKQGGRGGCFSSKTIAARGAVMFGAVALGRVSSITMTTAADVVVLRTRYQGEDTAVYLRYSKGNCAVGIAWCL